MTQQVEVFWPRDSFIKVEHLREGIPITFNDEPIGRVTAFEETPEGLIISADLDIPFEVNFSDLTISDSEPLYARPHTHGYCSNCRRRSVGPSPIGKPPATFCAACGTSLESDFVLHDPHGAVVVS